LRTEKGQCSANQRILTFNFIPARTLENSNEIPVGSRLFDRNRVTHSRKFRDTFKQHVGCKLDFLVAEQILPESAGTKEVLELFANNLACGP
jgi:hypothetical protein